MQNISGNIASNEKLTADCATFGVSVSTTVACQVIVVFLISSCCSSDG